MKNSNRLLDERSSHPLDTTALTTYLHGGEEAQARYRRAIEIAQNDPVLMEQDYSQYALSIPEARERTLAKVHRLLELRAELDEDQLFTLFVVLGNADASFSWRYGVHHGLFNGAIHGQGTEEQIATFGAAADRGEIIGCFSMTELGTGSYLQAFETTATIDPQTDEFVIDSPTLTSTKWWVGGLAQSATHTIVFAKLIIAGKDYGTHNFIVPLRDENHDPLPGIELGDVGPKRGRQGIDNGYGRFHSVRIPRTNMLMRWAQVDADGTYHKPEIPQLAYGAVIAGRVLIAANNAFCAEKALTIATRWSIVRDQQSIPGQCLLDYTTQQDRLIGGMAEAYAFHFATDKLQRYYSQVVEELAHEDLHHLKDVHNLSAGLKAFTCLWAPRIMQDCTLAMGGHGYSAYSALPTLIADHASQIPAEGDAIVMAQQTANYLVKTALGLLKGEMPAADSVRYLTGLATVDTDKCKAEGPFTSADLHAACQWLALKLLKEAATHLHTHGGEPIVAWNANQLELIEAAKAHIYHWTIDHNYHVLEHPNLNPTETQLRQLADLNALRHLANHLDHLLEHGYFQPQHAAQVRAQIKELYTSLRPYAAALTDAWDIPDVMLQSPLGQHDGNLYEAYFNAVKSYPQEIKPAYWEAYLKPHLAAPPL